MLNKKDDGNEDDGNEDDGDEDDGDEDSSLNYFKPQLAQLPVQIPQPINKFQTLCQIIDSCHNGTFLKYPITFERDFKLFI